MKRTCFRIFKNSKTTTTTTTATRRRVRSAEKDNEIKAEHNRESRYGGFDPEADSDTAEAKTNGEERRQTPERCWDGSGSRRRWSRSMAEQQDIENKDKEQTQVHVGWRHRVPHPARH